MCTTQTKSQKNRKKRKQNPSRDNLNSTTVSCAKKTGTLIVVVRWADPNCKDKLPPMKVTLSPAPGSGKGGDKTDGDGYWTSPALPLVEHQVKIAFVNAGDLLIAGGDVQSATPESGGEIVIFKLATFEIVDLKIPEFLASGAEEVDIAYTVRDLGKVVSGGTFQVLAEGGTRLVDSRALTAEEFKHGKRTIKWKGEVGSADTTDFPDKYVTVQFSPYQVVIQVEAGGTGKTRQVVAGFKVEAAELKIEAGEQAVLVGDEKYRRVYNGSLPLKGQKTPFHLLSNIFYLPGTSDTDMTTEDNHANRTDYDEYESMWGDGPLFPVVARVTFKSSQGPARVAPLAWGKARVLWEHKNTAKVQGTVSAQPWKFVQEAQNRQKTATLPPGDNCPGHAMPAEDFGGKRILDGSRSHYLMPSAYGTEVADFPFALEAGATRTWCVFSKPHKPEGEKYYGLTGVVFQPSRMAGDGFELHAWLDAKSEYDKVGDLGGGLHDWTGTFEIWREIEIRQTYSKATTITNYSTVGLRAFYDRAFLHVTNHTGGAPAAIPDAYYDELARQVNNDSDPYLKNYAVLDRVGQTTTAAAIAMRNWTQFKQAYLTAKVGQNEIAGRIQQDPGGIYAQNPNWSQQQKEQHARPVLEDEALTDLKNNLGNQNEQAAEAIYLKKCNSFADKVVMAACDVLMDSETQDGVFVYLFQWLLDIPGTNRPEHETLMGKAVDRNKPERRHRSCYVQFYPASNHTLPDTLETTVAHEIGHLLFLPHTASETVAFDGDAHDRGDYFCLMGYNNDQPQQFCGYCLLRLRGWDHTKILPAGPRNRRVPALKIVAAGAFGPTNIGDTSQPRTYTLTNTGQAPLRITAISKSAGDVGEFEILGNPGACKIDSGGVDSKALQVVFKPTRGGDKSMEIRVDSDDPASPRTLVVDSRALEPALQFRWNGGVIGALNLGEAACGRAVTKTLEIRNAGPGTVRLGQLSVDSMFATGFELLNDHASNQTIPANTSQTVDIKFTGTFGGMKSGTLIVPHTGADAPRNFTINVSVLDRGVLQLTASQTDAGTVALNASSGQFVLTFKNTGNQDLLIERLRLTTHYTEFEFNATPNVQEIAMNDLGLVPDQEHTMNWCFRPLNPGRRKVIVFVDWATTAKVSPVQIELVGTGAGPDLQFGRLDFRDAPTLTVHVGNLPVSNKGDQDLVFTLQSITFDNPEFSIEGAPATVTIPPNGTENLRIRFYTDKADIPCETTVTVTSNTPGAPRTTKLSVYATP